MTAQELIQKTKRLQIGNCVQSRTGAFCGVMIANFIPHDESHIVLNWILTGKEPKTRDHGCAECPHNDSDGTICTEPKCPRKSKA